MGDPNIAKISGLVYPTCDDFGHRDFPRPIAPPKDDGVKGARNLGGS